MKTKTNLKTKNILLFIAILLPVLFLPVINNNVYVASASDFYYEEPQITPSKMIALTNQSRTEANLPGLVLSQKLISAAEAKAEDMFEFQYFDHNSPSGVTPWDWIKSIGYDYRYAGENLAIDFVTANGAHRALMASDSHRENILNKNYTEIGIAVKKGIFEESESVLIVMEFGSPLNKKVASANENENFEPLNNIAINNVVEDLQKELVKIQPPVITVDLNNSQSAPENIAERKDEKVIHQNEDYYEEIENDENNIQNYELKWLGKISTRNIKKFSLDKVYSENIYWESYSERNIRENQTTVMSSIEQNGNNFNSNIFYACVLSMLFIMELLYIFDSAIISRKLEMAKCVDRKNVNW